MSLTSYTIAYEFQHGVVRELEYIGIIVHMSFEVFEEAHDFFEDIYEHLFEREKSEQKSDFTILARTKRAYHFSERIDCVMKIIFGVSIFVTALISTIWGYVSVGELVEDLMSSIPGRIALGTIGISYMINGYWRYIHIGQDVNQKMRKLVE